MIALVAILVMTPELVIGLTITDNFRFNLIWPEQFVDLFRNGHYYPRWLPRSWDGLGSPVFYFYPPLFFWVTSLIDALTGGVFSSERLVSLSSLILLGISGVTMRAWLRIHSSDARAILGAIAYMIAPYHLYDLYGRGALAEASTYASVPLIMLALARLDTDRRFLPALAVAFGLLLFSHLPTALLAVLFLIAPYVAFIALRSQRPVRFILRALSGGLLGIMLASVFIVPALGLLPQVSPAALSGNLYRPENWFFWHIQAGSMSGRMLLIVPISIGAFLLAMATTLERRWEQSNREPLFWAALTIFLVVLVAGLIPFVWSLPGLILVQFPWRALVLVEFTSVTMLASAPLLSRNLPLIAGAASLGFGYLVLTLISAHMIGRTSSDGLRTAWEIRSHYKDAPEYLPAGTSIIQGDGPDSVQVDLPRLPLASATDQRTRIRVSEARDGSATIGVDSPVATSIVLRRFYFPHWKLQNGAGEPVAIAVDPVRRVIRFNAPPGRSVFLLENGTAPYELAGRILTFIALLVLIVITAAELLLARALLATSAKSQWAIKRSQF